jgi:hypothetical protein
MDRQISLNLQAPLFTPEDKENGIKKVENWLTEKHDGLFRAIIKNGSDNELKIQCYCNATFVVRFNDKKYLKSNFTKHKRSCQKFLQFAKIASSKKRSFDVFADELNPILNSERLDMPSNNLSENFTVPKSSPLVALNSINIFDEVSIFKHSEGKMMALIKFLKSLILLLIVT